MSPVSEHYEKLLAPVYAWMLGGADAAFARGASELASFLPKGGLAVDLGAGFGAHAIPLARAGWRVLAIGEEAGGFPELSRGSARSEDPRNRAPRELIAS
jgi:hypothetical protein